MTLSAGQRLLLSAYGTVWRLARPVLARHRRLSHGFAERLVPEGWTQKADLWIQAASGGEAYLAWQLLRHLPQGAVRSVLLTSCTIQGRDILDSAAEWCREHAPEIRVDVRYFPVDEPDVMRRALRLVSPRAVVLLETELWPSLMNACAEAGVPYGVINGRMTPRSFAGYLTIGGMLRVMPPAVVLAMSDHDAQRYGAVFGRERVRTMPNIKFDRVPQGAVDGPNPLLGSVFKAGTSLAVLGSVREEEEPEIVHMVKRLVAERPRTCIALVPRHMERVPFWRQKLDEIGVSWALRSEITEPVQPGTIVLWNAFGELDHVYALSRGVFVGGSLQPLGGQNFLEPLAHGVVPVIGPYWSNFAWIGEEIMQEGLVQQAGDAEDAVGHLLRLMKRPAPKARVASRFADYVAARRGGAQAAADAIVALLQR
ncbi:3-deoxy-D-manno-octulosonic acid transferase [Oleidesulfovibrio sp.]|uniref:3-deoxy-D-manno-octulosonic acid transferase n=1 Tax=Oleidesulfovibrio sp. TaxID=2909707 RepID=UPI003A88B1B0